jgi:hypothetical protein
VSAQAPYVVHAASGDDKSHASTVAASVAPGAAQAAPNRSGPLAPPNLLTLANTQMSQRPPTPRQLPIQPQAERAPLRAAWLTHDGRLLVISCQRPAVSMSDYAARRSGARTRVPRLASVDSADVERASALGCLLRAPLG